MHRLQRNYRDNAKWLVWLSPFRALAISAAYLMPFFLQAGLNLSQIFLLQSIFSVATLLLEIPSGYFADRFGRAFSVKLSAPIAAVSLMAYGVSDQFWHFALCEVLLAVANAMISGVDTALLHDSLKADGREHEFVRISQRVNSASYLAVAAGVPVSFLLVHFVSLRSTVVVDGLLVLVGLVFALHLREAPQYNSSQEAVKLSVWHAARQLGSNVEARWLVLLGGALGTATYLAFWLSALYYQSMGAPVAWFGAILAVRSLWKAWLSHHCHQEKHLQRNMVAYATLAGLVYVAMASGQLWLAWMVLGHDVVQALQNQPITAKLNAHMAHEYRATMNSLVNLVQRLIYSVAGPLVGLMVDRAGLRTGLLVTGLACSVTAFVALARLHRLKTFQ